MTVNWYEEKVLLEVEGATDELLAALAFQVEGEAKTRAKVDTGFMRNSIYVVTPKGDDYAARAAEAMAAAGRAMAPRLHAGPHQALVAVGAEYAIHVETRFPFLYPALEAVAKLAGGKVKVTR